MRNQTIFIVVLLLQSSVVTAQSKIKDNTVSGTSLYPREGALLELESSSQGILVPRISLSDTRLWGLSGIDTAGMLVYNNNPALTDTATAPALGGGIGFYYWDGNRWVGMSAGSGDFWRTKGNTGTTAPAIPGNTTGSAHYWGTADAQNLAIGTNSTTRAIFDQNGNFYGGNNTIVLGGGTNALVWGNNNTDSATGTLVSGTGNIIGASAVHTVVGGSNNTVTGAYATVFGQLNRDSAIYSIVAGSGNVLSKGANNSIVTGAYHTLIKANASLDGVSGNAVSGQSNTLTAQSTGSAAFNGVTGYLNSVTAGTVSANYNVLGGRENQVYSAAYAAVFGRSNIDSASYTLVAGNSNSLGPAAMQSVVCGYSNHLDAPNAVVFGQNHKSSASNSLMAGYRNELASSANGSIVVGGNNYVSGNLSAIFGQDHNDSANYSLIAGQNNIVSPGMHHAAVVGTYNRPIDGALLVVGNGVSSSRSNAFAVTENQTTGATGAGQANGIIIMSAALPRYSSIANANADASLPSGAFYKISGAVYQKD